MRIRKIVDGELWGLITLTSQDDCGNYIRSLKCSFWLLQVFCDRLSSIPDSDKFDAMEPNFHPKYHWCKKFGDPRPIRMNQGKRL